MRPTVLVLLGACALIVAGALVDVALGVAVGGILLLVAGLLTAVRDIAETRRRPTRHPQGPQA